MSAEVVALPQIKRLDIKSTAPPPVYAELAVTSNFSFLRGSSSAKELVWRAAELGLTGIGIADRNTVAGVVRMRTALKDLKEEELNEFGAVKTNLKIAIGARLAFADSTPDILTYPQSRAAWSQPRSSSGGLGAEFGSPSWRTRLPPGTRSRLRCPRARSTRGTRALG